MILRIGVTYFRKVRSKRFVIKEHEMVTGGEKKKITEKL